jgi:anionic cell wall polymer biosynthesis LytR-Cps2A-Psr (LCP) family protein
MQTGKLIAILAVIVIIVTLAGAAFGFNYIFKNYIQIDNAQSEQDAPPDANTLLNFLNSGASADKLNILLLGISGIEQHSGELTDSIIFASINFERSTVNLFSIPRDLWIMAEDGTFKKINELYKDAGGDFMPNIAAVKLIKNKVEEITGQKIHNSAIINLEGIKELVDSLGGIETSEGFMNGDRALFYVRDRSRPGSDFDRMRRQQKLIEAIVKKISQENIINDQAKTMKLYEILQNNFVTDISLIQMLTLPDQLENFNSEEIGLYTITTNNLLKEEMLNVRGQRIYILYPSAGEENYTDIQNFISKILDNSKNGE